MALLDLPPLRESLEAHGLLADKRLGQHFLLDLNVTRKIARLAAPLDEAVVIEVGPGPGGLTRALLEEGAGHVVAIEKDARFRPVLEGLKAQAGGRLTLIDGDALKTDQGALAASHGRGLHPIVVANLPYNVGTALLVAWLIGPFQPRAMTLMFQKEVAERIVAAAGSESYGRLAVLTGATAHARLALTLPARAFTPPPRVDSSVVHIIPREDRLARPILAALERITAAAFGQRRKMLRSSLRVLGGEALCAAAGVDASARAEVVDTAGFIRLARVLAAKAVSEAPPAAP